MNIISLAKEKAGRLNALLFIWIVMGYFEDIFIYHYKINGMELVSAVAVSLSSIFVFIIKKYDINI